MSLPYIQQLTKVIVAQITQTIGWNSIQTTPLELITDILHKYLEELTRQTQRYTELYGRTEPNLDDIALAFNDLNINIADLEEYITNVDSVPCIVNVPKFPIAKESNLNFLKPGSKEVVTRPVHIHEHLPPIQPHEETPPAEEATKHKAVIKNEHNSANIIQTYISTNQISDRPVLMDENGVLCEHDTTVEGSEAINVIGETTVVENHTTVSSDENTFRKPFDVIPMTQTAAHRPPPPTSANNNENGPNAGRKTREIVSCFMTTGGFISPAREGKLPEARKPIIIPKDPEPEEIEIKQRTPSPEIIESKHHSSKRENKNDNFDVSKNLGKNAQDTSHTDGSYGDGENSKGVKLYEVIQTMPDALQKKKTKKSQIEVTQIKEQKKQKKLNQLKANRNNDHSFNRILPKGDGSMSINDSDPLPDCEKMKKKLARMETLKKKHKQKQLNGNIPFSINDKQEIQEKPRKKKMSKISKKNLQAIGLNPNVIEGFTIPSVTVDPYSIHETATNAYPLKESVKKIKQFQKLSTEPDAQKIKFFKKLSSTALLSKPNEDPHGHDRIMNSILHPMPLNQNDLNHQMVDQELFENDRYGSVGKFDHISGMTDMNRMPPKLDNLPPNKKLKLLKKLNKPPKEPKITKTKKYKKDPLAKKERAPKTPKLLDPPSVMTPLLPVSSYNPEENPLSKMFLNDEFHPNVGLINPFPMPGLNPFNPLFQSVRFDLPARDQIQNNPFGPGLQNFDFANLTRFKRPNFNESTHQKDAENLSKPLCNVAPLMPPSFDIEMHHKNEYIANSSFNEPLQLSQKHYQDQSNFGSKKSVMFGNANPQFGDRTYIPAEKHELYDSPIVISGDDDDDDEDDDDNDDNNKHRNPSHSPSHPSISGFEVKRKKVKDKKDKEKKEKKDKETGVVKLKKKKDKKDKSKNKGEHSKSPKDKSALKREKREKKKERERSAALANDANDSIVTTSNIFYGSTQAHSEWQHDTFSKDLDHSQIGNSSDMNQTFNTENSNLETSTIPKLTLKLAPSSSSPSSRTSRPSTPDFPVNKKSSKKKKKQWRTMDEDSEKSDVEVVGICGKVDETSEQIAREPSPELARISALITRPPKQKSLNKQPSTEFNSSIKNEYFDASVPARSDYSSSMASSIVLPPTPSGRGRPKGSSSLKSSKSKSSKASASFASDPDKKSQTFDNQSNIIDPHNVPNIIQTDDQANDENQVWICPACGRVDDGTPMIGCDGCDDWYHWVCVGILVPPNEDQDWFCRVCISRKQEDKKKKRKKKDKKEH